jgi:chemotaxis signal transduction protein
MQGIISKKKQRFILVKIGEITVFFPADLVAEIGIVERNKIMNLPFYSSHLKGCIYYNGKIISLVDLKTIFDLDSSLNREKMIVICLGQKANKFEGVGLIADQILGGKNEDELSPDLIKENQDKIKLFELEMLEQNFWEVQGYYAHNP